MDDTTAQYIYDFPLLSSWNGPAYLLDAVMTVQKRGIPMERVRLLPTVGHFMEPEVLPYQIAPATKGEHVRAADLTLRLGINVRPDNRLADLLPLFRRGMALPEVPAHPVGSLVRRFAEQLCDHFDAQFGEESESTLEIPSETMFLFDRQGSTEVVNPNRVPRTNRDPLAESPGVVAQSLTEWFYSRILMLIAGIDSFQGIVYPLRFEPEARDIDVPIGLRSKPADIARWYSIYPHIPVPARKGSTEREFQWTAGHPGIKAIYSAIQERRERITTEALLELARRSLTDFVPDFPQQVVIKGGRTRNENLLRLAQQWADGFLGLHRSHWKLFSDEEQGLLWALLLQRREIKDAVKLFTVAVKLLGDPDLRVEMQRYRPFVSRLGTQTAQLNRTLAIGGNGHMHMPALTIYIPRDATSPEEAGSLQDQLEVLRHLFLPATLAVRYQWRKNWARLGKTAYLGAARAPDRPCCRITHMSKTLHPDAGGTEDKCPGHF